MDKLYKLLKDYEGKDLDDAFIEEAYSIMFEKEQDLGEYLKSFRMESIGYGAVSGYSREDRSLVIDNELLKGMSESGMNPSYQKLLTLKTIKQGVLRARNLKTAIEGKDHIEPIILRCANRDYLYSEHLMVPFPFEEKDIDTLRTRKVINYDTDPDRRLSEIRAWKYLVNTLKNDKDSPELNSARNMLFKAYARGYKNNGFYLEPPTYEFLINMGFNRDLKIIKERMKYKKYSFDTRIEFGLPISRSEAEKQLKRKTKAKVFVIE